ncbi:formylglycine-generating enzyme family protein [Planctomycetales bacterium ZRK34]|nr:formylglycine-generating enzyme family protein [Planctomycetales bacterium ZRK34]
MDIVYHEFVDWEPLVIRLIPKSDCQGFRSRVERWLIEWANRLRSQIAEVSSLEIFIFPLDAHGGAKIGIEGITENALEDLLGLISEYKDEIARVQIGYASEEIKGSAERSDATRFVTIIDKTIWPHSNHEVRVEAFTIGKRPVTVAQFAAFAKETGYRSTNEQKGSVGTYNSNDQLAGMVEEERLTSPAFCVSYLDAIAYCEWTGCRLPTEAEWLAGFVLDWKESDEDISQDIWDEVRRRPDALEDANPEWTAEHDTVKNLALVRYGPHYLLEPGWADVPQRLWHSTDYADLCLTFRVVAQNPVPRP